MSQNSPNSRSESVGALTDEQWAEQSWLRSVIIARLGSAEGADDVLQEVRVAAIEQKAPLREPGALRSWLFQVAVRQSLLFLRRVGRYRRLLARAATTMDDSRHTSEMDGLRWLLHGERRQLIRQALREIDGRDRELLVLKYLEGWSYQQIAEVRGSSVRAVESRVCRARARLRQRLRQLEILDTRGGDTSDE